MTHFPDLAARLSGHTHVPPELLTGARVRLRQWKASDLPQLAALNADPEVMRHFPAMLVREQSDAHAARMRALIEERGWGFWALDVLGHVLGPANEPQFAGFVGLHTPQAELPFSPCVEVGWRLARPYWGHGLASEAARLALRVGFELLHLDEIVSFTALENVRSQRVMQRLGMHMSAADHFDHPAVPAGHRLRPHCLYRLSRAAWRHQLGTG